MENPFLLKEYIALALIKAKSEIYGESFTTTAELSQFTIFMQQVFNERELGIVIVHELGMKDFNVNGGIVTVTDRCCYDLMQLSDVPDDVLDILTDESLILEFFMRLENGRLKILKKLQANTAPKPSTDDKMLSLVSSKTYGKRISNLQN